MSASVSQFYLLIFGGSKATDGEVLKESGNFYNALILN